MRAMRWLPTQSLTKAELDLYHCSLWYSWHHRSKRLSQKKDEPRVKQEESRVDGDRALVIFCRDCHHAVHRSPSRAPGRCPGCGSQFKNGGHWWSAERPAGRPVKGMTSGLRKSATSTSSGQGPVRSSRITPETLVNAPSVSTGEPSPRFHTAQRSWTSLSQFDQDFLRCQGIRPWQGDIDVDD